MKFGLNFRQQSLLTRSDFEVEQNIGNLNFSLERQ